MNHVNKTDLCLHPNFTNNYSTAKKFLFLYGLVATPLLYHELAKDTGQGIVRSSSLNVGTMTSSGVALLIYIAVGIFVFALSPKTKKMPNM
jgi:hypothetical protein